MNEQWMESRLWFSKFNAECFQRLVLKLIKPVLKDLEETNILETFHFLFEPGPHLLFRIKPNKTSDFEKVKNVVKGYLKEIQDFIVAKPENELFTVYQGEVKDFGEDVWEIAKKVFEMGSRMAVGQLDPEFKKQKKFDEGKILQLFS